MTEAIEQALASRVAADGSVSLGGSTWVVTATDGA